MSEQREACMALAEVIAEQQWVMRVEEEQSKSDYDVNVPEWESLGDYQNYLINEARPLAYATWKAGWRPTEARA